MPERFFGKNRVVVSPPVTFSSQVSALAEVRDDALDRSLGDSDSNGHVTGPDRVVLMDAYQDMSVVRQEGPFCFRLTRNFAFSSHSTKGVFTK